MDYTYQLSHKWELFRGVQGWLWHQSQFLRIALETLRYLSGFQGGEKLKDRKVDAEGGILKCLALSCSFIFQK